MIFEIIGLLLLSQLLLGIYLWYQVKDLYKYPNLLGSPIIGNLYYFYKGLCNSSMNAAYQYEQSIAEKYGDGMCFTFLTGRRALILSCPNLTEKIAHHPSISDKAPHYAVINGVIKGTFSYRRSDEEWKLRRKEMNNFLTKKRIESQYFESFVRTAKNMVENVAVNTKNVDIAHNMLFFSLNITIGALCGFKHILRLNQKLYKTLEKFPKGNRATEVALMTGFSKIVSICPPILLQQQMFIHITSFGLANPVPGFLLFYTAGIIIKLFPPTAGKLANKLIDQSLKEVEKIEKYSAEERRNVPLSWVITLRNKKRNLKNHHISLELYELMIASSHTVSIAMTGALASLAVFPEIQEKAWKEQFEIFDTDTRDPTVEDVKNMHYLDRFIKETLRFFGVPQVVKLTTAPINLGGAVVPSGTAVYFLLHKMQMDPQYWKNPQIFDPDRFLDKNSRPKYSYAPFGVGIRSCPGMQYTNYEMKIALSALIRRFKLSSSQKFEDFKLEMLLMTEISNLSCIQAEERKNSL